MKRLFLLFVLVAMVAWITSVRHDRKARSRAAASERARAARVQVHVSKPTHAGHHDETSARFLMAMRDADDEKRERLEAVAELRDEAHQAVEGVKAEVCEALDEAARDVREALDDAENEIRQSVDEIPVPIVPGTRVVEALPEPPQPPQPPRAKRKPKIVVAQAPKPPVPPSPPPVAAVIDPAQTRVVAGLISATKERAEAEARKELEREVTDWLEPEGVPRSWKPSGRQIDDMIVETSVDPVVSVDPIINDYGTMYVAKTRVDVSPARRAGFVETYQRQLVHKRMGLLGGLLGFILICLGAISGYIRADEATKGYYTNRLRMLAAAGVGAAGVVIYQMVA
jgi:F0F1-type ATP synthase membrane subunit b/b'